MRWWVSEYLDPPHRNSYPQLRRAELGSTRIGRIAIFRVFGLDLELLLTYIFFGP